MRYADGREMGVKPDDQIAREREAAYAKRRADDERRAQLREAAQREYDAWVASLPDNPRELVSALVDHFDTDFYGDSHPVLNAAHQFLAEGSN